MLGEPGQSLGGKIHQVDIGTTVLGQHHSHGIAIGGKDIETAYLFVGKELEQMRVHAEVQRRLLLVKKNNIILLIKNITLIWHKKFENR